MMHRERVTVVKDWRVVRHHADEFVVAVIFRVDPFRLETRHRHVKEEDAILVVALVRPAATDDATHLILSVCIVE